MELNLRLMEFEDGFEKKVQSIRKETSIECNFYIRENQVEILEEIGRGTSGRVFKGKLYDMDDLKKGEYVIVALKEINNPNKRDLSELNQTILNEVSFYRSLRHQNLICILAMIERPNNVNLIAMELAAGKCLYHNLHGEIGENIDIDDSIIVDWALQITDGLIYMHQFRIIHCDLKSRNILIDIPLKTFKDLKNATLKLANLSFLNTSATPSHMAPEVMKNYICRKSDVWSFGVTLWEIIHKTLPYQGLEGLQILYKIGFKRETLNIKDDCNPDLAAIMKSCWIYEYENRPNFGQIHDDLLKIKNKIGNCKTI